MYAESAFKSHSPQSNPISEHVQLSFMGLATWKIIQATTGLHLPLPIRLPVFLSTHLYVQRFNQGDPELPTHVPRKRSGLPTDWVAEETTATSAEETPASPDASTPSQTADGTYATMN